MDEHVRARGPCSCLLSSRSFLVCNFSGECPEDNFRSGSIPSTGSDTSFDGATLDSKACIVEATRYQAVHQLTIREAAE